MPFLGYSLNGFNTGYKDWLILNDKISSIFLTFSLAGVSAIPSTSVSELVVLSSNDAPSAVDITCIDNLCRDSLYIIS